MPEPLSRDERDQFWAASGWDRGDILEFAARYEATCQDAEARIEALRAALDRALYESVGGLPMAAERTMKVALSADEPQASGDYSVTRTPESAGGE